MNSEMIKPPLDGFWAFEGGVEGGEERAGSVIQGQLVKFTNEATWITGGGEELPSTLELVAVDVSRVVQKWLDQQPVETRVLEPGEKFPDLEALNAAAPKSEWREGPNGQSRGPWQTQYLVYLLDADTVGRYTYPTGTIGGGMAVRDLVDRTKWMRKFRGVNVFPVVTLGDAHMNTRFGGRQRPHFNIVRWIRFDGDGNALPAATQPALTGRQTVDPPSVKEATGDSIPH